MNRLIATDFFKALGDTTRLKLVITLRDKTEDTSQTCNKDDSLNPQSMCVCELTELLEQPQPTISRHLNHLKRVGILTSQRRGTWMWYGINQDLPKWCKQVINEVEFIDD